MPRSVYAIRVHASKSGGRAKPNPLCGVGTVQRLITLVCVVVGVGCLAPRAHATGQEKATAGIKGTIGLGLLGAETVLFTEAALGVKSPWLYLAGGGVGAAGGAVGGYFVDRAENARLSTFLLAGGMALIIPATVVVLSQTAYPSELDYTQDQSPADEPIADPPERISGATRTAPISGRKRSRSGKQQMSRDRRRSISAALFDYGSHPGALTLQVPAVEVRDVYPLELCRAYGLQAETELSLPVVNIVF